jgi:hypothetical protein
MDFPKMLKKADGSRLVVADQAGQDVAAASGWLTSAQLKASLEAPAAVEVVAPVVEPAPVRRGLSASEREAQAIEDFGPEPLPVKRGRPRKG